MSATYIGYVRKYLADDLPRLHNYREAQLWHDAVKPFGKGRSVGMKPLGRNRRYDRFTIRAVNADYESNGIAKSYVIKHYATDVLRYNPDGSLTINSGGYDSISTTQSLQELLGVGSFVRRKMKTYYRDNNGKYYRIKDGLKVNADNTADTSTLKPEKVHELDRPMFKQIRERYKDFMEYALLTNNLTQGGEAMASTLTLITPTIEAHGFYRRSAQVALVIDTTQIRWYRTGQLDVREVFFSEVERAMQLEGEDKYKAYHRLATFLSFSAATNFTGTSWQQDGTDRLYKWEVDNKRLKHFFDGLLKFRFPTLLFKEVEVPLGTIRHDTNKKYFEFGTV